MLQKIIEFTGGFDKRNDGEGIGALQIKFLLKGDLGAVQFSFNTRWYPESVELGPQAPMPLDLGYHAYIPQYENQPVVSEDCPYIEAPCYYDGSTLNADPIFKLLVEKGEPAVWRALVDYYNSVFGTSFTEDALSSHIVSMSPATKNKE